MQKSDETQIGLYEITLEATSTNSYFTATASMDFNITINEELCATEPLELSYPHSIPNYTY